jgi:hypothetical protein
MRVSTSTTTPLARAVEISFEVTVHDRQTTDVIAQHSALTTCSPRSCMHGDDTRSAIDNIEVA